jgi:hypothetical protein
MLLNILLFPIFVYILSLYGSLFKKIFKIKIEDCLFINLIFGFFFITILLFFFSFFINIKSILIYFVLLILFLFSFKYFNQINLINFKKNIFIILSVSLIPAIMEIGYDSHLYHIPYQTWLQEDKIIFGMANLNLRFGISSIYSYFSSILWFNNIFLFVSYLTSIFYLVFFLFIYEYLSSSNKKLIYSLILVLSFPLWSRYSPFAHSLIDVQFGIILIILFTFIIFNYEKWFKKNFSNSGDLYFLGILFYLLFTLKPSGILLSPLFYQSTLQQLEYFSWVISPLMNLINYVMFAYFVKGSDETCVILLIETYCKKSNYLFGNENSQIPDSVLVLWTVGTMVAIFLSLLWLSQNYLISFLLSTSYPVAYAISRGNPDIFAAVILCIIMKLAFTDRIKWSFFLAGLLAGIKLPFAFVFLPLILIHRKISCIVIFSLTALSTYILPLLLMSKNGTVPEQLKTFLVIVERYNTTYVKGDAGLMHSNSILSFTKTISYVLQRELNASFGTQIAFILYAVITLVLSSLVIFVFLKLIKLPLLNSAPFYLYYLSLLFCTLVILAPGVSQDYRLVLLVPFLALSKYFKVDVWTFIILSLILISKNFLHLTFQSNTWGTTIGAILNPVLLLALLLHISQILLAKGGKAAQVLKKVRK